MPEKEKRKYVLSPDSSLKHLMQLKYPVDLSSKNAEKYLLLKNMEFCVLPPLQVGSWINYLLIPTEVRTQKGREKNLGKVYSRRLMMELATSQLASNN